LVEQLREAAIIKRSHDLVVAPKCGLVLARRSALNQAVDRAIAGILKILPAIRACRAHRADEFIVQERVRHSQARGSCLGLKVRESYTATFALLQVGICSGLRPSH